MEIFLGDRPIEIEMNETVYSLLSKSKSGFTYRPVLDEELLDNLDTRLSSTNIVDGSILTLEPFFKNHNIILSIRKNICSNLDKVNYDVLCDLHEQGRVSMFFKSHNSIYGVPCYNELFEELIYDTCTLKKYFLQCIEIIDNEYLRFLFENAGTFSLTEESISVMKDCVPHFKIYQLCDTFYIKDVCIRELDLPAFCFTLCESKTERKSFLENYKRETFPIAFLEDIDESEKDILTLKFLDLFV